MRKVRNFELVIGLAKRKQSLSDRERSPVLNGEGNYLKSTIVTLDFRRVRYFVTLEFPSRTQPVSAKDSNRGSLILRRLTEVGHLLIGARFYSCNKSK